MTDIAPGAAPLQAFGQLHKALRENEKKITSSSAEFSQRLESTARQLQKDGRRLRAETSGQLADLEELVLQMYEEHEAGLQEARESTALLRRECEAEQAAHRAALVAQQGQIDALAAALRRQTELLDEHVSSSALQMGAVQAEAAELHSAFKAQGAAVQATKAFISSVDEKLSAQIDDRAQAADTALNAATNAWQSGHNEHAKVLERILSWEPQLKANEESLRTWWGSVDESIQLLEKRAATTLRDAESSRVNARAELNERIDEVTAGMRELEGRWPEWIAELRREMELAHAAKANASETEEQYARLEERLEVVTKQQGGGAAEVQLLHNRLQSIERIENETQAREAKRSKELAEVVVALQHVHTELQEAKQARNSHKQAINTLAAEEASHIEIVTHLEDKLRQVTAMAEEQARFLTTLCDVLHDAKIPIPKFRSSALGLPATVAYGVDSGSVSGLNLPTPTSSSLRGSRTQPALGPEAEVAEPVLE